MDERVKKALAQWPDVPDVYGWLSLDRRGRWRIRGETISNPNLIDFINRNYLRQRTGSYAFQNGPQRVHVELAVAPWIADLEEPVEAELVFVTHTGQRIEHVRAVYLDTEGQLLLQTELGPALVREQALAALLPRLTGPGGRPLDAAKLEAALADPQAHRLQLQLSATEFRPLQLLQCENLERTLGFIRHPHQRTETPG